MIDLETETIILPREVCLMFPGRSGKGVSLATIWRWMLTGCKGCKLESIIVGGQRYTSEEAVQRFVVGCSAGRVSHRRQPTVAENRMAERIEHELKAEGL